MDNLPDDIVSLRALAATALARVDVLEFEAAQALAIKSGDDALIAAMKLEILKLRRELYGTRSERKSRLLDQLELQLEELEANAGEDELKAEQAAAKTTNVQPFTRKKPSRKPFRSPSIFPANGWCCRRRTSAHAVAATTCANWARR